MKKVIALGAEMFIVTFAINEALAPLERRGLKEKVVRFVFATDFNDSESDDDKNSLIAIMDEHVLICDLHNNDALEYLMNAEPNTVLNILGAGFVTQYSNTAKLQIARAVSILKEYIAQEAEDVTDFDQSLGLTGEVADVSSAISIGRELSFGSDGIHENDGPHWPNNNPGIGTPASGISDTLPAGDLVTLVKTDTTEVTITGDPNLTEPVIFQPTFPEDAPAVQVIPKADLIAGDSINNGAIITADSIINTAPVVEPGPEIFIPNETGPGEEGEPTPLVQKRANTKKPGKR